MAMGERVPYGNPAGESLTPESANLQRFAAQPLLGCWYLSNAVAAGTLLGSGGYINVPFQTVNNTTVFESDPYGLINRTTSGVKIRETGLYYVRYRYIQYYGGNTTLVDAVATDFRPIGTNPSGWETTYTEYRCFGGAQQYFHMTNEGYLHISSPAQLTTEYSVRAFCTNNGGLANGFFALQNFELYLISKTNPSKF